MRIIGIFLYLPCIVVSMTQDGEAAVREAYPELFVSFTEEVDEEGVDFEFELESELSDEEWSRMPPMLTIYDVDEGVFRGAYT